MHLKTQLTLGVATAAMVSGLATPANAACTVDGTSVNCTADSTAAEVNAAIALVGGPDVSLTIAEEANVAQPGSPVSPSQQGAVTIGNAGTLGTEAAQVGVNYVGTSTDEANTFSLTNSGDITGNLSVNNVGGATTVVNSGLIANGVTLFTNSSGNISFSSAGNVASAATTAININTNGGDVAVEIDGNVGTPASEADPSTLRVVAATSQRFTSIPFESETVTEGTGTTTTTTSGFTRVGGAVTVDIGEDANTGGITTVGLDGASVNIDGTVGSETQFSNVVASSNTVEQLVTDISTNDGTDSSFSSTNVTTALGAEAAVTIGATGSVNGNVNVNGFGGATVSVAGAVGTADAPANINATSSATNTTNINTNSQTGTVFAFDNSQTNTRVGGQASVTVTETGVVTGFINANGLGGATVSVDGSIGSEDAVSFVNAFSFGDASIATQGGTFDSGTGASTNANTFERASTGGDTAITIGETAVVNAFVNANGNGDATVEIAGFVGSGVNSGASGNAETSASENTNDGEGNTTFSNSSTFTSTGGNASVAVAEGGAVVGGVNAFGVGGAAVAIDGTVGLPTATTFVNANSSGSASSFSEEGTFDADVGASTYSNVSESANIGGDAIIEVGETGVLNASVDAFANGDAIIANAGTISGFVNANASGSTFTSASENVDDGAGSFSSASESLNTATGGTASVTNAAGGLIGLNATSPINVSAFGNTAADISNSGRINGNVNVNSNGFEDFDFDSNSVDVSTDATTLVVTTVENDTQADSFSNLGGDATFTNAAGGLITGSVSVNGTGSATVINSGAVIGTTFAGSQATDTTFESSFTQTTVFVPGVDGGTTAAFEFARSNTRSATGGDVVGTYAGTNGAVQFAPFGGASDGSVRQEANGNSIANVTGTIFGSFSGRATGEEFAENLDFFGSSASDADGDLRTQENGYTFTQTNQQSDSDSTLAVSGGTITNSATIDATGSASALITNGGAIDGSLNVTAQGFGAFDYLETNALSEVFDEDGVFVSGERVFTRENEQTANTGNVAVTIGDGTVGGNVFMNGAAGTNMFALGEEGAVGGSVTQQSNYSTADFALTETTIRTGDDMGGVDTVVTTDSSNTTTASGGNVSAVVAGTIGNGDLDPQEYGDVSGSFGPGLSLSTNAGNATATVTGQVRGAINVIASGSDLTTASQQTRENGLTTALASQDTSVATGGTATLMIDAADIDTPANFGNITVIGRNGSTVTIGEDSTVLAATNGAFLQVGGLLFDTASTNENVYTGTVLTGQEFTSEFTAVGGVASLTNDGRIGFDGGSAFDGDDAGVLVFSITEAEATNNGQIYGSIDVTSGFTNVSTTTTRTDLDDVTRVDVTDRVYTPVGGTATLINNGLITGDASLAGLVGTMVNDGVLRGDLLLGGSLNNYVTRTTDTLTQLGEEEVLELTTLAEQGYAVEQNGFLGGTIVVEGAFGLVDDSVQTSNITADIALNSGSVTGGGVVAEYDEETGERFTATTVTLAGSGFLGLGDTALDALEDAFSDIDPAIADEGDLSAFAQGARVLGVDTVTKTGAGVFLITGADFAPISNTNRIADYTFDVGTFAIAGGEIQLATIGTDGVFGIRGDIANSGTLVLGSQVQIPAPLFGINQSVTAIDGVEVYQQGNFVQSGTGTLTVGITPTLVRVVDPAFSNVSTSTNLLAVQQISLASGLFTTPENAFGQAFTGLGTGFLTVDGNLNLGGTVQLVSPTGGIFADGQRVDIASVSGTVTAGANVVVNRVSNFVTFDLATRAEGGRTIVFASADRTGFETVGNNQNAIAAATALSQALPGVVTSIQTLSAGGIGIGGDQFVLAQDLANIIVGFDSLLTTAQVTTALNELASGEFYGSITTLETTAPFVDAISAPRLPVGASGFNLWFAPSGDFVEIEGDAAVGSADIDADNYGASGGFGVATGDGEFGVGFGYGRISSDARDGLLTAEANTLMIGLYARQSFGNFSIGADLVYGWSDWNASRVMPTLSRVAEAEFDSTELRGSLRADYTFDLGGGWVAPFAQLTFRNFDFDGFSEEGAGSIGFAVEQSDETILQPVLGLRAGTSFETGIAKIRPELSASYTFNDDQKSFRDVAYLGAANNSFRLQGVEPEGYFTLGAGLYADIATNSGAFIRGNYATGGNVNIASLNAGVTIGF